MLKRLMAVLVALAFAQSAWAQQMLGPSDFRDAAIARVQAEAPEIEVERVGELGVIVRRPVEGEKPQESTVNFDAGYREYLADPTRLDFILGRWTRLILAPSQERGYERIISVLRHRDMANAAIGGQQVQLVWRPFAGDLIELLAFDSAEQIRYATHADLEEIEITEDAAWALTPANVRARMGPLQRERLSPTIDIVSGENGITPSLLTVPDFCGPETLGKIYLVADRNVIVIGDAETAAGRQEFLALSANLGRDSLSATPLECRDGRLQRAGD